MKTSVMYCLENSTAIGLITIFQVVYWVQKFVGNLDLCFSFTNTFSLLTVGADGRRQHYRWSHGRRTS